MNELRGLLFEELTLLVKTSVRLIGRISPADADYRPRDNMRSLQELVHHLASIPSVDLLILQEKSEPEIRRLEAEIAADTDPDKLGDRMMSGMREVERYMTGLSDEDFLRKSTKPFYLEHDAVQAKWLIEIVTHVQHHRAQLFNYMKQLGYAINMFDLYSAE
ncbi:DinB family protein [Cohnella nanjingensis]|uniref:DinB family protein n=1 Tax=Cohnella nanjingensis TaxID=1387779 RepID=UPI0028A74086|nr:DinB family protein [Cohnella nanjingensis]